MVAHFTCSKVLKEKGDEVGFYCDDFYKDKPRFIFSVIKSNPTNQFEHQ